MEVNVSNNAANWSVRRETANVSAASSVASEARVAPATARAPLTITRSAASPEDISAAAIPESALTRTDALGQLVASAFDLPPPPMPNFASL